MVIYVHIWRFYEIDGGSNCSKDAFADRKTTYFRKSYSKE